MRLLRILDAVGNTLLAAFFVTIAVSAMQNRTRRVEHRQLHSHAACSAALNRSSGTDGTASGDFSAAVASRAAAV